MRVKGGIEGVLLLCNSDDTVLGIHVWGGVGCELGGCAECVGAGNFGVVARAYFCAIIIVIVIMIIIIITITIMTTTILHHRHHHHAQLHFGRCCASSPWKRRQVSGQ